MKPTEFITTNLMVLALAMLLAMTTWFSTSAVLPQLRESGWDGYWIDAASAKRMDDDSVIVLDPVNRAAIDRGRIG